MMTSSRTTRPSLNSEIKSKTGFRAHSSKQDSVVQAVSRGAPSSRSADPPTTEAGDRGSLLPDWLNFTQCRCWLVGCKTSSLGPLKGVSAGSAAVLPWLQHNRAFPRSVGTLAFSVPPELGCNCAVDNESWELCNLCVVLLTAGE